MQAKEEWSNRVFWRIDKVVVGLEPTYLKLSLQGKLVLNHYITNINLATKSFGCDNMSENVGEISCTVGKCTNGTRTAVRKDACPALQLRGHLGRQNSDLLLALQGLLIDYVASRRICTLPYRGSLTIYSRRTRQ